MRWSGTRRRRFDKAIADLKDAIRLKPDWKVPWALLGTMRHRKKDYDAAIVSFDQVIRLDPTDATAHGVRGEAWSRKGEHRKAIADFDQVIRLNPGSGNGYVSRAKAKRKLGLYDEALADYEAALRVDPKHASAWNSRAWLWATSPDSRYRDGRKAVESATRACELTLWKNGYYLDTLAAAYAEAGEYAKAVEWEQKAIPLYDQEGRREPEKRLQLYRQGKPYREE